jgi:hypothetical protein
MRDEKCVKGHLQRDNLWSRIILEKLMVTQLVKELHTLSRRKDGLNCDPTKIAMCFLENK